ncbi:hypothetical protein F5B20DRAFT_406823 [Whalleya microplaca]|nr:hypothetical protein F5B20DRAFT_406823 [Whalleya microplaca]
MRSDKRLSIDKSQNNCVKIHAHLTCITMGACTPCRVSTLVFCSFFPSFRSIKASLPASAQPPACGFAPHHIFSPIYVFEELRLQQSHEVWSGFETNMCRNSLNGIQPGGKDSGLLYSTAGRGATCVPVLLPDVILSTVIHSIAPTSCLSVSS